MLKRLIEKLKGSTFVTEERIDAYRVTMSGTIPSIGRWPEEPYIVVIDALRTTVSRRARWVKPVHSYRYRVVPMTAHAIPVETRCRTIVLTERLSYYMSERATTSAEALVEFLAYVHTQRAMKRIAA